MSSIVTTMSAMVSDSSKVLLGTHNYSVLIACVRLRVYLVK